MKHCPFNDTCTGGVCDRSCPSFAEISYLLERNSLLESKDVYKAPKKELDSAMKAVHAADSKMVCVISPDTIATSNILAYCAICENWKGNQLHCSVFRMKFSKYMETLQGSFNTKETPESLEMETIFAEKAKVLIVANLDYVKFTDFHAQKLLSIIHSRMDDGLSTIIVSPKLNTLVGSGAFFSRLLQILGGAVIKS